MLKFEKSSSDQQIHLILRDKDRLFSRSFFIALLIAATFHAAFFILFHVGPFKLRLNTSVFPPVQVEASVFQDALVVTDIEHHSLSIPGLPPPRFSVPVLPEHPSMIVEKPMGGFMKQELHENPFDMLEKEIYQPGRTLIAASKRPSLNLVVSGKIKERELLSNGLAGKEPPVEEGLNQEGRIVYTVLIEGKTGRIIWQEPKQVAHVRAWDLLMEKVLQDIRFAPNREAFVVEGEIELQWRH